MLKLTTTAAIEAAIANTTCSALKQLLTDRLADTIACDLQDLTHVIVATSDDREGALAEVLGFAPTGWDWREKHGRWCEYLYLGNDGFASIVFVKEPAFVQQSCEGGGR